eukprot:CAMPEP_0206467864 /NCGR_PEP_ID=MMETSP0324_2-20121206/29277_1 /ASSEMBLY_ACC=CAM_ASM_000836 /TAXON_ID=2866 /ORGANISM="Crypthecodinium cohnii, Strain Seligo" /LENGTH=122 /DNA_ID=CAMNT_0053941191 /DNA_START=192 /DNA_END=557 /DNA_ORIENTATION=-
MPPTASTSSVQKADNKLAPLAPSSAVIIHRSLSAMVLFRLPSNSHGNPSQRLVEVSNPTFYQRWVMLRDSRRELPRVGILSFYSGRGDIVSPRPLPPPLTLGPGSRRPELLEVAAAAAAAAA